MTVTRTDHNQTFDPDGNLIDEEFVEVDITDEANTATMVTESDEAVDKLIVVVEALNALVATSDIDIQADSVVYIKDLARALRTVARAVNQQTRLTSGRTEDVYTGTTLWIEEGP